MAAVDQDKVDLEETGCLVCKEEYKDPRSLDCGHFFCRGCLEGILREDPQGPIKCPTCRGETHVIPGTGAKALKRPLLETLKEKVAKSLQNIKRTRVENVCGICDDENAQSIKYCYQCAKYLCQNCCDTHTRRAPYHQCAPCTSFLLCQEHDKEILSHYCADCKRAICSRCFFKDHADHQTADIQDTAEQIRQRLEDLIAFNKVSVVEKGQITLQRIRLRLQEAKELKTAFKDHTTKTRRLLKELGEKLEEMELHTNAKLDAEIKTLDLYESDVEDLIGSRQSLMDFASQISHMESALELVENEKGFPKADDRILLRIEIAPVELPLLDKLFPSLCCQLENLVTNCKMEFGRAKIGDFVEQHRVVVPHTVGGLAVDIKRQRFVARTQVPQAPLMVFTYSGQLVETLGAGVAGLADCGESRGIALDTKRDLYMAPCKGSLLTIDRAGKIKETISVGNDNYGVAYSREEDLYLVTDVPYHRVCIIDPATSKVNRTFGYKGSGPTQFYDPYNIHVGTVAGVGRPCIIVSDRNNHCIKLYDTSGTHVKTYGSQGAEDGQLQFPNGVCTDPGGRVIVCDRDNQRIVSFWNDSAGQEHWECLLSGDWGGNNPTHLALDTDSMIMGIVDSTHKTLHIYN